MARVPFDRLKVGDILEFDLHHGDPPRWQTHRERIRTLLGWSEGEFTIEFWPNEEITYPWRHSFMEREFGQDTRPNRVGHLPLRRAEIAELASEAAHTALRTWRETTPDPLASVDELHYARFDTSICPDPKGCAHTTDVPGESCECCGEVNR